MTYSAFLWVLLGVIILFTLYGFNEVRLLF